MVIPFTSKNLQFRFATHFGESRPSKQIGKPIYAPRGAVQLLERIILVRFSPDGNDRSRHSVRQLLTRNGTIFGVIPRISTNESANVNVATRFTELFSVHNTRHFDRARSLRFECFSTTTRRREKDELSVVSHVDYLRAEIKKKKARFARILRAKNRNDKIFFDKIMEQKELLD